MKSIVYGRELLSTELPVELRKELKEHKLKLNCSKSYIERKGTFLCRRCNTKMIQIREGECICGKECAYCRNCLKMGKVRKCATFYSLAERNKFDKQDGKLLNWKGKLSEQQELAAKDIVSTMNKKETRLLWAVAGAGKTEMLFLGIKQALKSGERVCIASPRIDVCLELALRIKAAFPTIPLTVLHGEMEQAYEYTQLVIATTHQLLRFKAAFDLLIIDEIDAFPFEMDQSLQYAANKARKKDSALIYLSATPNREMQKEVKKKMLKATILPARYHGYPLPLPQTKWCVHWQKELLNRLRKTTVGKAIDTRIQNGQRFLVFLPNIQWMLEFEKVLRKTYPTIAFESVSSVDSKRKEKVLKMRENSLQFMLTTTILERGVTFPNIDVLVIGAEDRIYTESALVQIAGRCGRSFEYPTGDVIFYHDGKTLAMKRAIQQIKRMNRLAQEKGLIK